MGFRGLGFSKGFGTTGVVEPLTAIFIRRCRISLISLAGLRKSSPRVRKASIRLRIFAEAGL